MTTSLYLGFDNGLGGGICALSATPGAGIIAMRAMPVQKARKGMEVDVKALWAWIQENNLELHSTAIIETPSGSKSANAAKSMAASFAALRCLCELKGIPYKAITAHTWQKPMLAPKKGDDTKVLALAKAKELWPNESWLATKRSSKAHSGLFDAALIAQWAMNENL